MRTFSPDDYRKIYELLDPLSPVPFDCGKICGAACCKSDLDDEGLFLLPGEEKLHEDSKWALIEKHKGYTFVKCKGPKFCERTIRPIQCRTFPMLPVFDPNGRLTLIYNDMDLSYGCPIIDSGTEINREFIENCQKVI